MERIVPELRQSLKERDFKCGTEEHASISVLPSEAPASKKSLGATNELVEEVSWGGSTMNFGYKNTSEQGVKVEGNHYVIPRAVTRLGNPSSR